MMTVRKAQNVISLIFLGLIIYTLQNLIGANIQAGTWDVASRNCSYVGDGTVISEGNYYNNYVACGYVEFEGTIRSRAAINSTQFVHIGKESPVNKKNIAVIAEKAGTMRVYGGVINGEGVADSVAFYASGKGTIDAQKLIISNVRNGAYATSEGTVSVTESGKFSAFDVAVHATGNSKVILKTIQELRAVSGVIADKSDVYMENVTFRGTEVAVDINGSENKMANLILQGVHIGESSSNVGEGVSQNNVPKNGIKIKSNVFADIKGGTISAKEKALDIDDRDDRGVLIKLSNVGISAQQIGIASEYSRKGNATVVIEIDGGKVSGDDTAIKISGKGMVKLSNGVTIASVKKEAVFFHNDGSFLMDGGMITATKGRAVQLNQGRMYLDNVQIKSEQSAGVWVEKGSVEMNNGGITASKVAVLSKQKGASVILKNVHVVSSGTNNEETLSSQGGTINVTGGMITGKKVVVQASNAGNIMLSGVSVSGDNSANNSSNVENAYVLFAKDSKSNITVNGGSIDAKKSIAVGALNGGIINLSGNVKVSNEGEYGLWVGDNKSRITINDGSVKSDEAVAVYTTGGIINVNNGNIISKRIAVKATNNGSVNLNGVNVKSIVNGNNKNVYGLFAEKEAIIMMYKGNVETNGDIAVSIAASDKGSVNLNDVTVKNRSNGNTNSYGLFANSKDAKIVMNKGSVEVTNAVAVKVLDEGSVDLNNVNVMTIVSSDSNKNQDLYVLFAKGEKSKITMTGGSVKSDKVVAVYAHDGIIEIKGGNIQAQKVAVKVLSGGVVKLENTKVENSNNKHIKGLYGLWTENQQSKIIMSSGSVESDKAIAVYSGGVIEIRNGKIQAKRVAVKSVGKGVVKLENTTVEVNNASETANSYGLWVDSNEAKITEAKITMIRGSVKSGEAVAVYTAGGTIDIEDGEIQAKGVAVKSQGKKGIINLKNTQVETTNDSRFVQNSYGLLATQESKIIMNDGSIKVNKIAAIMAEDNASIKLSDVKVENRGVVGIFSNNASIEINGGSIAAKGSAVKVLRSGSVNLIDVNVKNNHSDNGAANNASEFVSDEGSKIIMTGGSVKSNKAIVFHTSGGSIDIEDGNIQVKKMAVKVENAGVINLKNTQVESNNSSDVADSYGFLSEGEKSKIIMSNGAIKLKNTVAVKAQNEASIGLSGVKVENHGDSGLVAEGGVISMIEGRVIAKTVGVRATGEKANITLKNVEISVLNKGEEAAVIKSEAGSTIKADGVKVVSDLETTVENVGHRIGVYAKTKGKIGLNNTTLEGVRTGLRVEDKGTNISMTGGKITAITGIYNTGGAVTLMGTEVVTRGGSAGIMIGKGGKVEMFNGRLNFSNNGVSLSNASFTAKDVFITGIGENVNKMVFGAAFYANKTGLITFNDGKIDVTYHHGLQIMNDTDFDHSDDYYARNFPHFLGINIARSEFSVKGSAAYGIYVRGSTLLPEHKKQVWLAESPIKERVALGTSFVSLQKTTLTVPDSAAIYSDHGRAYIQLSQGTEVSGSLLLETREGKDEIIIVADDSSLTGGTRINGTSNVGFYLSNNSKWTLTKNQYELLNGSDSNKSRDAGLPDSSISFLHLNHSSIAFASQSVAPQEYQTLRIGKPGTVRGDIAYYVSGGAHLYLNAYVDEKGQLDNQKTDRVLIEGSVAGSTTRVHVNGHLDVNDKEAVTKNDGKKKGISIIQVSGEAYKDSFELESGYTTLGGLPYQYRLKAYGPKQSDAKKEKSMKRQRFVSGNGDNFWDFRLQEVVFGENGEELDWDEFEEDENSLYGRHARPFRAIAPQVPVYLVLPNAFFHADLMDINYQNKLLETIQIDAGDLSDKISVQGYDGSHRYTSNLTKNEYGYGADVGYQGVQGSALLKTIENKHSNMFFGVMGNFGHLSLQPKQVAKSLKSTLDKWSLTAYGRVQHDNGFYANGTFSYGFLAGDVLTAERGVAVNLRGQPLSASLTTGKTFVTNYKGLVFEPQIQLIYQSVAFNETVDVDCLNVQFDRPDQFTMRVGGRFGKAIQTLQRGHFVSFYGRVHFTSSYGGDQFVYIHDAFRLGAFGSAIEGGFGVNAQLTSAVMIYGDLVYKHKLDTFGFTGTSVSGGLRYRF
ncbi:hypothetical protein [Bartonella bacilliformis]|uniref:hypothetical protein n=2 Tax=Bartonella bacilliformis TaxID=774 RepID=UPI0039E513AB